MARPKKTKPSDDRETQTITNADVATVSSVLVLDEAAQEAEAAAVEAMVEKMRGDMDVTELILPDPEPAKLDAPVDAAFPHTQDTQPVFQEPRVHAQHWELVRTADARKVVSKFYHLTNAHSVGFHDGNAKNININNLFVMAHNGSVLWDGRLVQRS